MAKIGKFKILESFNVTNRGIVVVGYFTEGHAKVGSRSIVEVKGHHANVKIIGTETGGLADDEKFRVGLLLSFENSDIENVAKTERIKEQTIEIAFD